MKINKITDEEILFDNGYSITYYHEQNCCEDVYADFKYLNEMNILPQTGEKITIYDIEFNKDIDKNIEEVEDMGFRLVAKDMSKWFVPCYDEQNGCYSSDLNLIINKSNVKINLDITGCTKFIGR